MQSALRRLWWLSLGLKLIVSTLIPLAPDEAYYWVWGQYLDWSYFDHPGMVGWIFKLAQPLSDFGSAVRWPFVILGHISFLFWLKAFDELLLSPTKSFKKDWLWIALLAPLLGLGSMVATPDVLVLFFWSASFYFLVRAFKRQRAIDYCALGMTLGLGFCAKYIIVLFLPCVLLLLMTLGEFRRRVRWQFAALTVIVGLLFCFPVLYWNALHEWVSFKFQLDHGLGATAWNPQWTTRYISEQLLLIFPVLAYFIFLKRPRREHFIFFIFGIFPILFFLMSSFKGRVEANWPITAYPALYALALLAMGENRRPIKITLAVWGFAFSLVASEVAFRWLPIKNEDLKIFEHQIYDPILAELKVQPADQTSFLDNYQMASTMSFKLKKQFYKLPGLGRVDMYDFWKSADQVPSEFIVYSNADFSLPKVYTTLGFKVKHIEPLAGEFKKILISK